jgi:serine/threonine-protein kinase
VPVDPAVTELWRHLGDEPEDFVRDSVAVAGCRLGQFRIEERIGRGGMGAVFRAVDEKLDRMVALKVLAPTQAHEPAALERFRNEARAAARLDHDNIARVYTVGEDRGLSFIAFEFVHGSNVRDLIDARGPLPAEQAVNYALQVTQALRHTSAAGVVHRDIKPSNIIISPQGRAKLVDLGLARNHDPQASHELTVDGTTLGTFDYISPEQAKDPRSVDVRSDIYSLGCTLFHMLTGSPPYPRGTVLQKLLDHQGKHCPDPARLNADVPLELSAIVRRMMAADPAERYQSAEELLTDLSLIAQAYGLRPTSPDGLIWVAPPPPTVADLWRRNGGWIGTALLLLVVVFAIDRMQKQPVSPGSSTGSPVPFAQELEQAPASVLPPSLPTDRVPDLLPEALPQPPASVAAVETLAENTARRAEDALALGTPTAPATTPAPAPTTSPTPGISGTTASAPALTVRDPEEVLNGAPPPESGGPLLAATSPVAPSSPDTGNAVVLEPPSAAEIHPFLMAEPFAVLVSGVEQQTYRTLEAACADAPDNAVIEVRFDGRLRELQRPLRVVRKRLRIRPASGVRPTLAFAPLDDGRRSEIARMILVDRGSVEFYDLDLELVIDPEQAVDQWTLLSLSGAEQVALRGVAITVRNSTQKPCAVVELMEPPGAALAELMPDSMSRGPELRFTAEDCVFRSDGDLFWVDNVEPGSLTFRNSALAVDRAGLRIHGSDLLDVSAVMSDERRLRVTLEHVTARAGQGLARMLVETDASVPGLEFEVSDSVLVSPLGDPLIEMSGELELYEFQSLLSWLDMATFLDVSYPLWRIVARGRTKDYSHAEWDDLWKRAESSSPLDQGLLNAAEGTASSQLSIADLRLRDAEGPLNPALAGASDGTDAGVDWTVPRLPTLRPREFDPFDLESVP